MSSKIIENIEQAIKRFDLINRPYIAFLNPDDVKVLKPVLPKIEKDIVIQSTAFVGKGKCVVMKRKDLELSAIIEQEGK